MRHKRAATAFYGLILVLCAWPAQAQVALERDDLYRVEVVVFERAAPADPFYRFPGVPRVKGAMELFDLPPDAPTPVFSANRIPFWPVEPSELLGAYDRLARLGEYRPMTFVAWEQAAEVFGPAAAVRLKGGQTLRKPVSTPLPPVAPELEERPEGIYETDGILTLERGRFMHVSLDVIFRTRQQPARRATPALPQFDAGDEFQVHRITESRQVRLGQVQYFDHAQFGILVLVEEVAPDSSNQPTAN